MNDAACLRACLRTWEQSASKEGKTNPNGIHRSSRYVIEDGFNSALDMDEVSTLLFMAICTM